MSNLNKTVLSDGDYTLGHGAWFEIGPFAVRINKTDEGIAVDVYQNGHENCDSIVSCYAFNSEADCDCDGDQGEPIVCPDCELELGPDGNLLSGGRHWKNEFNQCITPDYRDGRRCDQGEEEEQ